MTSQPSATDIEARTFYNAAPVRVLRMTAALGTMGTLFALARFGWHTAVPLAVGALLGGLNFAWLARSSVDLLGRVAALSQAGEPAYRIPRGGGAIVRFVLRYALIIVAAYAIFSSSVFSILGFFVGLAAPVAALMFEAVYELWVAYRRGL